MSSAIPRIFLSHSHLDNAACQKLVGHLREELGLDDPDHIFYDESSIAPGSQWLQLIQREVLARPIFILYLSPNALTSQYVKVEVDLALRANIEKDSPTIISLLTEQCDTDQLAPLLRNFQMIDLARKGDIASISELLNFLRATPGASGTPRVTLGGRQVSPHAPLHEQIASPSPATNSPSTRFTSSPQSVAGHMANMPRTDSDPPSPPAVLQPPTTSMSRQPASTLSPEPQYPQGQPANQFTAPSPIVPSMKSSSPRSPTVWIIASTVALLVVLVSIGAFAMLGALNGTGRSSRPTASATSTNTVSASPTVSISNVPAGFIVYEDAAGLFQIAYPTDWTKTSTSGDVGLTTFSSSDASDSAGLFEVESFKDQSPSDHAPGNLQGVVDEFLSELAMQADGGVSNDQGATQVSLAGENWTQESGDLTGPATRFRQAEHVVVQVASHGPSFRSLD